MSTDDFKETKEKELKGLMSKKEEIEFELYKIKTDITTTKRQIKSGTESLNNDGKTYKLKWSKAVKWKNFYRLKAKHLTYRLFKELVDRGVKTKDMPEILGCSLNKAKELVDHSKYGIRFSNPEGRDFINFNEMYHKLNEEINESRSKQ